jgi:hypothetical protein
MVIYNYNQDDFGLQLRQQIQELQEQNSKLQTRVDDGEYNPKTTRVSV